MKANSVHVKLAKDAWPRLCALALVLSIAGCATQVTRRGGAEIEHQNDARARAIGTVALAGARGVGGAAVGALAGAAYGLQCGLLAPICMPIGAVVGSVVVGVKAIASTPGLGDAIGDTTEDREISRSSSDVDSLTTASPTAVRPDAADVAIASHDTQIGDTTQDGETSPSSSDIDPLTTASSTAVRPDASDVAIPSHSIQTGDTSQDGETSRSSSDVDPLTTASSPAKRPDAADVAIRSHGMRRGDRWEYAFVDSRNGRPASRRFEIEQVDGDSIVERIEFEDGRTFTAAHHDGAYLNMLGGMQFAPYYFAFRKGAAIGSIDDVKVEGGEACVDRGDYSYGAILSCEVRADFVGIESVAVPAGTFKAQVVRVTVTQERIAGYGGRVGVVGTAQFWISSEAGRIVKAAIKYEADRPWTETMELVSYRDRGRATTTAR